MFLISRLSNGASMKYGSGTSVLNRVVTTMAALQPGDYYDWSSVSPEGVSRNYAIKATVSASKLAYLYWKYTKGLKTTV